MKAREGQVFDDTTPMPRAAGAAEALAGQDIEILTGRSAGDYSLGPVIGSGGMGVIYAATDTKLQRKVAIKVIRNHASAEVQGHASSRLVREAQSMAKLSHPNVVGIYQVGTIDEQVFVAMEFIDGQTLSQWLAKEKPTWREALDVLLQAGRGLEAAHAANLIHRDFKPDNVLIGRDGRVLVTDFGLARAADLLEAVATAPHAAKDVSLTMTGAIMGTPAYMSPEQHEGSAADARTDQYSYCVALYEALNGVTAFGADSYEEIVKAKDSCAVTPAPRGSRVPRWLRAIVMRGMSPNRDHRFAEMRDLLAAIDRGFRARRRGFVVAGLGAGIALALATAAAAGAFTRDDAANPGAACNANSERVAKIWNAGRKPALHATFTATAKSYAEPSWNHVDKTLDAYASAWTAMYRDACDATYTRREQSAPLLDRRMVCLRRRAEELRAVVELFATADAAVVSQSAATVNGLSRVEDCSANEAMTASAAENTTPEVRAQAQRLSDELALAKTLTAAAKAKEAMPLLERIAADAKTRVLPSLEAEALVLIARLHADGGKFDRARDTLVHAIDVAERARDVQQRAQALVELVYIEGYELRNYAEAHVWARMAASAIEGSDALVPLAAQLLTNHGTVYFAEGKYQEATEAHAQASAMQRKLFGPNHIGLAVTLDRLGSSLLKLGKGDEAIQHHRAAIEILSKTLGESHLYVADTVNSLGNALADSGDLEEAAAEYRRAIAIWKQSVGDSHARAAVGHANLGAIAMLRRDYAAALSEFQSALELEEKAQGGTHPSVAETLTMIGLANLERKSVTDAVVALERATKIWEGIAAPPLDTALTKFTLARAVWDTDRKRALKLAHSARNQLAGVTGWHDTYDEIEAWLAEHE